jgi:DNA helicase-2/ATP-dependent DNA helicase PcrA
MNPLLDRLNPPQLAAVTLPPAHALILAGAGSGKTRVLTTRIAWLITVRAQVDDRPSILAVTFTNKAAKEMLARVSAAMLPVSTCAACGSAPSTACRTACCAPTTSDAGLPQTLPDPRFSADQLAADQAPAESA